MGMGGGSSSEDSEVVETPLSKKQLEILRNRHEFYQAYTEPALQQHFEEAKQFELSNDYQEAEYVDLIKSKLAGVNDRFKYQEDQLSLGLSKRGLEGSGIEAKSLGALNAAKSSTVANAVNQSRLETILNKNSTIDNENRNALAQQGVQQSALQQLLNVAPQSTLTGQPQVSRSGGKSGGGPSKGQGALGGAASGAAAGTAILPGWGTAIGAVVGGAAGYFSS